MEDPDFIVCICMACSIGPKRVKVFLLAYILKSTANRSPYIFTLVQKVKHRVYKIHVFSVKRYFVETLQVISFNNDVYMYFLHGRS